MFTTPTDPTLTYRLALDLLEARRREAHPLRRSGAHRSERWGLR